MSELDPDRQQLSPYGLTPVYIAAGLLFVVVASIIIDRIQRCRVDTTVNRTTMSTASASSGGARHGKYAYGGIDNRGN